MSKNNSKGFFILNFLFFWLLKGTIYGHINYDIVNERAITSRVNQKTNSFAYFLLSNLIT